MKLRLLPVLIFCAAFALSLKLASLWLGYDDLLASSRAIAQEKPAKDETQTAEVPPPETAPGKEAGTGETPQGDEPQKTAGQDMSEPAKAPADTPEGRLARFDPSQITDSELNVLHQLARRRAELERREAALDTRAKLLRATEQRIEAKITELKEMQVTITRLLKKHDKEKEAKMRSVVKIYEKMKPKDAARIFEQLDMRILLDVIERMREARTAPIMANMTPAKAKAVTAALAERRALPKPQKREEAYGGTGGLSQN